MKRLRKVGQAKKGAGGADEVVEIIGKEWKMPSEVIGGLIGSTEFDA